MAKMRKRSFHPARRMRLLAKTFVFQEKAVLPSPCTVQTPHLAMPRPMGVRDLRRRVPPGPPVLEYGAVSLRPRGSR